MEKRHLDEKWVEHREDHWKPDVLAYVSNYGNIKRKNEKGDWYLCNKYKVSEFDTMVLHGRKSPNFPKGKIFNSRNHSLKQITLLKKKLTDPNRKTRVKILAQQFNISVKQARRIKNGESWGEIKVSDNT